MAYPLIQQLKSFLLKHSGSTLVLIMVIIGVLSFHEYGMSWDESVQRIIGNKSYDYVFKSDESLLTFEDRDYGVAFELPLVMIEKLFSLEHTRNIFYMRHLVTHLFFLMGAFACYKLTDLLYKNKFLCSIAFLLFILHPHIYAHSFFNTKDFPFLTMFMICFYLCVRMLKSKTVLNGIFLGSSLGLLINMRIMGVLLLCFILFFLVIDAIQEKKLSLNIKMISLILVSCLLTLYISWPYLWKHPVENFSLAFKNMSHFRWKLTNLFNGKLIAGAEVGWEYIPVWFSITTPIPYLLAGLIGVSSLFLLFIKKPWALFKDLRNKSNLLFLICFLVPVLAVIVLKSVLYDAWRQLFFIYPPFIMLSVYGISILVTRYKIVT